MEFIRSVVYGGDIHWVSFMTGPAVMAALPFVAAIAAVTLLPRCRIGVWPVLLALCLFMGMGIDAVNGSSALSRRDVRAIPTNLAGSSWHSLARMVMEPPPYTTLAVVQGGGAGASRYLGPALESDFSVLYVIVESLGVHKDARVRQWLQAQLFPPGITERYSTSFAEVPSRGGTTLGEMRRQCGLYGSFRNLTLRNDLDCIAGVFAKAGWTTLGMHGFSEGMFARRSWWPSMGFQEVRFAEELADAVDRRCSVAFCGVCDEDLVRIAGAETQHPRRYVHALTLNSHLPLAPVSVPADLQRLCSDTQVGSDVCTLLATRRCGAAVTGERLGRAATTCLRNGDW